MELCNSNPVLAGTSGPVDVSDACPVLAAWDRRDDLDSPGAILFRRFAAKALALPGPVGGVPGVYPPTVWDVPFDAADPVNTPRGLNTDDAAVRAALADAVAELRELGIPLDARLREWQYEKRGEARIPIHGGPGGLGVFNAISAPFRGGDGFPDITSGSSFVMAAHMDGGADGCPESRMILTYSLSANPASPHYADQTRMYSRKQWLDMLFCVEDLLRTRPRLTELGCVAPGGFTRARVGGRSGALRVRFRRVVKLPVRAIVSRAGGSRVARARRMRPFVLHRSLAPGRYVLRLSVPARKGTTDRRELPFAVTGGGTVRRLRPFSRPERCGLLRSARLGGPVFGGALRVRAKLGRRARATATLLRGGRLVERKRLKGRGLARRARFATAGAPSGAHRVRIVVRRGKRRARAVLHATRR